MATYAELDAKLQGRCKDRRKLENNTFAERRYMPDYATGVNSTPTEIGIAVRLHATDILFFFPDGRIKINTGGWDTVLTKDRLNSYLPNGIKVYSESVTRDGYKESVWFLFGPDPSKDTPHTYQYTNPETGEQVEHTWVEYGRRRIGSIANGMVIDEQGEIIEWPDGYDPEDERARNALIDKLIKRFNKSLTPARFNAVRKNGDDGDCHKCLMERSYPDSDNDHLFRHLALREYQYSLMLNALADSRPLGLAGLVLKPDRPIVEAVRESCAHYFKKYLYFKKPNPEPEF